MGTIVPISASPAADAPPALRCSGLWKSFRGRPEMRHAPRWALRGIDLTVPRGRALGVIGPGGSGKTTLLSVLLGAVPADRGEVGIDGRPASLLELGAGFQGHLTGRENVFLYGAVIGMSIAEVRSRLDAIAEFAEMQGSLDRPLRKYSAGMIARLRFSIIIHSPADVLLVDEVLSVGDARFQQKCRDALRHFKARGGTLLLVSHDMEEIEALCDEAICLDYGRVVDSGPARRVVARYRERIAGRGARGTDYRISLLVPTRGRAELAHRFLESVLARSERPDLVEVVLYADEDDPASHNLRVEGLDVRTIVGPRVSMGEYNSACLARARGDIVVLGNDDVVIQTRGWDRKLRELQAAMQDQVYLAYPNDLFKGRRLSSFPILSRRTCELLGEPFPRAYRGAFIDQHLLDLFKRLERHGHPRIVYLEDVVFEHMHFRSGKGDFDQVYGNRGRFADDETFLRLRGERSAAAARLRDAIDGRAPGGKPATSANESFLDATLFDRDLSLARRLKLFLWLAARRAASRVL
jgi:ABC-type polysaccharide/polyol phosphate transport system ATPase subunit